MIPANSIGSQRTKTESITSTSDIADVTIVKRIRPLQYICNLETMTPPRSWPKAPPGIKTSPKGKKEEEETQLKIIN